MKKIGLVGGTGPESTLMYYKELNSRIDNLTGEKAMPDIAIESVNFRRAWEYVCNKDYEALSDYLAEKVKYLEEKVIYWKGRSSRAADPDSKNSAIKQRHLWQIELNYWSSKLNRFLMTEVKTDFVNMVLFSCV